MTTASVVLCLLLTVCPASAQDVDDAYWTPSGEGFIYLLLLVFFGFNFIVPPARLFYDTFLKGLIAKASEKVLEIQAQITERLNDASRKVLFIAFEFPRGSGARLLALTPSLPPSSNRRSPLPAPTGVGQDDGSVIKESEKEEELARPARVMCL
jgi:hypothetical protein